MSIMPPTKVRDLQGNIGEVMGQANDGWILVQWLGESQAVEVPLGDLTRVSESRWQSEVDDMHAAEDAHLARVEGSCYPLDR